jgi:hypothetical protein
MRVLIRYRTVMGMGMGMVMGMPACLFEKCIIVKIFKK